RYVEPHLQQTTPEDVLGTPDILLTVSDEVLVFDNLVGKLILVIHANPELDAAFDRACARLDELVAQLKRPLPEIAPMSLGVGSATEQQFHAHMGEARYKEAVERTKQYTLACDVMQVVPSQRLSIDFDAEPLNLYRALRSLNPSPYMYFLDLGDHQVVG